MTLIYVISEDYKNQNLFNKCTYCSCMVEEQQKRM